jgi:hypothetical protein
MRARSANACAVFGPPRPRFQLNPILLSNFDG